MLSVTVTVTSATSLANRADCVPAPGLVNNVTVVDNESDTASDGANQSCLLPHLIVAKTPDNGTYALGSPVSFTIVVTNDGAGIANNVHFAPPDALPDPGASLNWGPANPVATCRASSSGRYGDWKGTRLKPDLWCTDAT